MAPLQLERRRRHLEWLLWPLRLMLLVSAFELTWRGLYPHLPSYVGLPLGGLLVAGMLSLEVLVTARIRRQEWRRIVGWRLLVLDRLLSKRGEAYLDQPRAQHPEAPMTRGQATLGRLEAGEPFMEDSALDDDLVVEGTFIELDD